MNDQNFAVMHGWMLDKISDSDLEKITVAEVEMNGLTPINFSNEHNLEKEQLKTTIKLVVETAYLQSIKTQYFGLDEMMKASIMYTGLNEQGMFPIRDNILVSMAAINTFFSNVLIDGNRLIDSCEKNLKKTFNKDSEKYLLWKNATSFLYDNDLIYMLSGKLRNAYEHEYLLLNFTSIDTESQTAYAVLDFDHELLSKKNIPANHRKLREFIEYRASIGMKPKRNIGTFIHTFFSHVRCLYGLYSLIQTQVIEECYSQLSSSEYTKESKSYCLITRDINKKGFPSIGLFYIYPHQDFKKYNTLQDEQAIKDIEQLLRHVYG